MSWFVDVLALVGFACVVTGTALIHTPSAFIVAGVLLLGTAITAAINANQPSEADE